MDSAITTRNIHLPKILEFLGKEIMTDSNTEKDTKSILQDSTLLRAF